MIGSPPVATVKVVSDHPEHDGFIVINESDFDPSVHTLWGEQAETAKKRGRPRKVTETALGTDS